MKLHLLAVGQKMPAWVQQGCAEYDKRMPPHLKIQLKEIPPAQRAQKKPVAQYREEECQRLAAALPPQAHVVMLDVTGKAWSTEELAQQLDGWQQLGQPVALTIGGPDGYTEAFRQQAQQRWSMGPLTLPHPLVRVVLYEQLYRAYSILAGHPYHRA